MKNRFEVRRDVTVVFLHRKDNRPCLECLIDTADLPLVSSIEGSWVPSWGESSKTFYCGFWSKGVYRRIHSFIMEPPSGMEVDHIHHNGLDNRRSELKIVTRGDNLRNRRPKHKAKFVYPRLIGGKPVWDVIFRSRRYGRFRVESEAIRTAAALDNSK